MSSWLLLSLLAPPTGAVTAEQAMTTYRETFTSVPARRCAPAERADELVVCARLPEADRLPLPFEPEPGAPPVGETGAGRAQAAAGGGGCLRLCHQPVRIDVIGAGKAVAGALTRLIGGDD